MRNVFALIVLLLAGCSSRETYPLTDYPPLEAIYERPALVRDLGSDTAITTVGKYCYVKDLDDWLVDHPPASAFFKAVMRHEQEHSRRQLEAGTTLWVARYLVDATFALDEEKIGYYYEITERRRLGDWVAPEAYANSLSHYKIATGDLISYADALEWVNDVLDGRWTPPN